MSQSDTASFPFMKLPPELREKVYRYHLVLPEPIKPTKPSQTTFVYQHINSCPLSQHTQTSIPYQDRVDRTGKLRCKDPFTGIERQLPLPESVLAILLVSRQICSEAAHIYYRLNHFIFTNVGFMHDFILKTNKRYRDLAELSFAFSSIDALTAFTKLMDCQYLKKLHIDMRWNASYVRLNTGRTLATALGMKELRKIRGIEVLDLVGMDHVKTAAGDWMNVDIDDEAAIGPQLRRELMKSRVGQ